MMQHINDLLRFYSQQYHVPIALVTESYQFDEVELPCLLVGMPVCGLGELLIGESAFRFDPDFGGGFGGDLIVVEDQSVGRMAPHSLMLQISPKNASGLAFVPRVIDQYLPRLCRRYRHELRDGFVAGIASCVQDRKRELQSTLRENHRELERLSAEVMQLARTIETDRQILKVFEKSPEWIDARSTRTFVDLMKLVPSVYSSIWIVDNSVYGRTHEIVIDYDGGSYRFDPYQVQFDISGDNVFITGGCEAGEYIHPHVASKKGNICWGNVSHLISRLSGELDLFGLFQLVHQFLNTYNSSDPFQRIEKWDPHWVEDDEEDDEPYCSWCDDYGHEITDCEHCWFCEFCDQWADHHEEDCPKRAEGEEKEEADAELAESESA